MDNNDFNDENYKIVTDFDGNAKTNFDNPDVQKAMLRLAKELAEYRNSSTKTVVEKE